MTRHFHYECDERTYQIIRQMIGGKEVYNKEFKQVVSKLLNDRTTERERTPLGVFWFQNQRWQGDKKVCHLVT